MGEQRVVLKDGVDRAVISREACDVVARVCRTAIVFGESGERLATLLRLRRVTVVECGDLEGSVTAAAEEVGPGVERVVFSPLFPVSLADRERFAALVANLG